MGFVGVMGRRPIRRPVVRWGPFNKLHRPIRRMGMKGLNPMCTVCSTAEASSKNGVAARGEYHGVIMGSSNYVTRVLCGL